MPKRSNPRGEIKEWRNFTLNEKIYDLSHLNAHSVEYIDDRDTDKKVNYKFDVTYSFHCFTKDTGNIDDDEKLRLIYKSPLESRSFNFERYELSKNLPAIIESLGQSSTLVCHAGYGNYAAVKIMDFLGNEITYFVYFKVFSEKKKFRIHVASAYPREEKGKIRKVKFFTIAKNLLLRRSLPQP
jgi:hypothetical protein